MIIYDMEQGTEEWLAVRRGKLTGSNATAIGNAGKGLDTYIAKIVLDIICPENPNDRYTNYNMERGHLLEPAAKIKYEFTRGATIRNVGFIQGEGEWGVSPDGIIMEGENIIGGIEVKARNKALHYAFLRGAKLDSGTDWQIQMCIKVTSAKWWDFISYNNEFSQSMKVIRVFPDEKKQDKLAAGIEKGCKMVKERLGEEVAKKEIEFLKSMT